MATHHRRIIVVNDPLGVPKAVTSAQPALALPLKAVNGSGEDRFAPGPDRIELLYMFTHGDENRGLTVYQSGRVEVHTLYTSDAKAHEAADRRHRRCRASRPE